MNDSSARQPDWDERPDELIGGKLVMMACPTTNHNQIVTNIVRILGNYLHGKPCRPFADNTKVFLSKTDHFIPDAMVVCDADKVKYDGVHGAPDLVVEVLSPSTAKRDKLQKKDAYEKAGVREYWLISPYVEHQAVEVYLLRDGHFVLDNIYTRYADFELADMKEEERAAVVTEFRCSLFDDLSIRLEDVFERIPQVQID